MEIMQLHAHAFSPGLGIRKQTQLKDNKRGFTSVFSKDIYVQQFVKVEHAKTYTHGILWI